MVLICIFLIISHTGLFYIYLHLYMFLFNAYSVTLSIFQLYYMVSLYRVVLVSHIFWILIPCQLYGLQIASPVPCAVSSLYLLFLFFSLYSRFLVWYISISELSCLCFISKKIAQINVIEFSSVFFNSFIVSGYTSKSFIHFSFIFVYIVWEKGLISSCVYTLLSNTYYRVFTLR